MFNFSPTDEFLMYLRKSRADLEAESRGAEDTLKRHERLLRETADRLGIIVQECNIYREVVTGETIAERIEMQKLLRRVQTGTVRGVLVMEVERLSRGDTIDQGIVAQTFKYSDTLIITPIKIYDPNDEYDEEYFEFGLFQSRREYKAITRRLQRGRRASVVEGKFVSSVPPYGYLRKKLVGEKGWILDINPEEAETVKLIFDMYVNQNKGLASIADKLDLLGYKPRHNEKWSVSSIRSILANPAYIGKIVYGFRKQVKVMRDGRVVKIRPRNKNCEKFDGRHPAIIDEITWNKAQKKIASHPSPRTNKDAEIKNPLAGILVCGMCGRVMRRKTMNKNPTGIICATRGCRNVGSYLHYVEEDVIKALDKWLEEYKLNVKKSSGESSEVQRIRKAIERTEQEINTINKQIDNLRDLLEKEVYTIDVYMDRFRKLDARKKEETRRLEELKKQLSTFSSAYSDIIIPRVEHVLETYYSVKTPEKRNQLLKTAIKRVEYIKNKRGGKSEKSQRNYELIIQPLFFIGFDR